MHTAVKTTIQHAISRGNIPLFSKPKQPKIQCLNLHLADYIELRRWYLRLNSATAELILVQQFLTEQVKG
jgi:hypothetical protein